MRTIRLLALLCLWLAIPGGLGHAGAHDASSRAELGARVSRPTPARRRQASRLTPASSAPRCRVPLDYADPHGEQIYDRAEPTCRPATRPSASAA